LFISHATISFEVPTEFMMTMIMMIMIHVFLVVMLGRTASVGRT